MLDAADDLRERWRKAEASQNPRSGSHGRIIISPEICLAGPQVAAVSLPSGWVETIGFCCDPDRSRNGGEASASVILLKADGGEVLSRPSGWTYGIECAQRTAVRARILPSGWRYGQPKTAPIFMSKSRMSRHRISRSLTADDWQLTLMPRSQVPTEFRERKTKYSGEGSFSI